MPFSVEEGEEPRSESVEVRLRASEKQRIRDDADLAGLTISEFVRRRSLGRSILAAADLATVRELRRLGGLLKHVHVESRGAYSKDTAAVLDLIRKYIDRLGAGAQAGEAP